MDAKADNKLEGVFGFAKSPTPGIYVSRRFKSEMKSKLSGLNGMSDKKLLEIMPWR